MFVPLPGDPAWIGLIGALGVAGVVALVYALRDAGPVTRQVAVVTGVFFVAYALMRTHGGVLSVAGVLSSGFLDQDLPRAASYLALTAAGLGAGVGAGLAAHRRAAEAADDLADDALVEPDDDVADVADVVGVAGEEEPDDYTLRRQRIVAAAPWFDVAALVIALALPVMSYGLLGGYADAIPVREVTAWSVLLHLASGAVLAAPLLVLLSHDVVEPRILGTAAVLLAVRQIVVPMAPEVFSNDYWTAFGAGLVAGLLTVAALPLVSRALPEDRRLLAYGVLAALALLVVTVVAQGRAQFDTARSGWTEYPGAED